MNREELENLIKEIDNAILNILTGGQSVEMSTPSGTRKVTRSNLTELRKLKKEIKMEIRDLDHGGGRADNPIAGW